MQEEGEALPLLPQPVPESNFLTASRMADAVHVAGSAWRGRSGLARPGSGSQSVRTCLLWAWLFLGTQSPCLGHEGCVSVSPLL